MKACKGCGEQKPREDFYRHPATADGLRPRCKKCMNADSIRWRKENPERAEASREAYRERHNEVVRRHRARHPHVKWEYAYRRRARRLGVEVVLERFTRDDVIQRYGDACYYCSAGAFEQLDHFVAIVNEGPHTLENVRPSCQDCNRQKAEADKIGESWQPSRSA